MKWVFYIIMFCLGTSLYAQRKNEFYYLNYQYQSFDENYTIQSSVNEPFANFGRFIDGVEQHFTKWYHYVLPGMPESRTIGYKRYFNKYLSLRINALLFYYYGYGVSPQNDGQINRMQIHGGSFDYLYNLHKSKNSLHWINALAGFKYREGSVLIYQEPNSSLQTPPFIGIQDYGVQVGLNYSLYLPWNFLLGAEVGVGRWLYLEYNHSDSPENEWGMPRNSFDMRLSIGYTFGKKISKPDDWSTD